MVENMIVGVTKVSGGPLREDKQKLNAIGRAGLLVQDAPRICTFPHQRHPLRRRFIRSDPQFLFVSFYLFTPDADFTILSLRLSSLHVSPALLSTVGEKIVRDCKMLEGTKISISDVKDEIILQGNDIEKVSQSAASITDKTRVKNKDVSRGM